jgi:hypothetical protein
MLHITNGDSTVARIVAGGIAGTVIPWRDPLHVGPIPADLDLDSLRKVRARYIASYNLGTYRQLLADLRGRDRTLITADEHEEVVLWFEHDLHDQFQLLQILDWFARHPSNRNRRSLICIDRFPGVEPFHGLGQLSGSQMATLFPTRQPVSREQLQLARSAWAAIRSADPTAIEAVIASNTDALPFLRSALTRLLEEYPSAQTGLSRTEHQALEALLEGPATPVWLFQASNAKEDAPFLGDIIFWTFLYQMSVGPHPLIASTDGPQLPDPLADPDSAEFAASTIQLTDSGRDVLAGKADAIDLNGIDRWIGGVHLSGAGSTWRWDETGSAGQLFRVA